jgi:hypothetical protein
VLHHTAEVAATIPLAKLLKDLGRKRRFDQSTTSGAPRETDILEAGEHVSRRANKGSRYSSDSGKRYRIHHGTSMNVHEMDDAGHPKSGWCFVPNRRLAAGDVMLAQKIALETCENSALAVAHRFPPNQMTFRASRRRPY